MREGRPDAILALLLGGGRREGEARKRDDGSGVGGPQHAVALVRHGEETLVGVGAWGPSLVLDVLAGGETECLGGVVIMVHVGWQHLLMV